MKSAAYSTLLFWVLLGFVCAGHVWMTQSFWSPAHAGADQNGYLMGGKLLAEHGVPGILPPDGYRHVGGMFVQTADGRVFPKYPAGLPLLVAICLWTGKLFHVADGGVAWAFLISPIATALAMAGTGAMMRRLAGDFAGILAALLLGFSQLTLAMANNPNSHAPALACVAVGMAALLAWWETDRHWLGVIGGFAIGYACTIRYTEGLLVLPLAWAVACRIATTLSTKRGLAQPHPPLKRTIALHLIPLFTWSIPVLALLVSNRIWMGHWTGYDVTRESTAFNGSLDQAELNHLITLGNELFHDVAYFIAPVALLGLLALLTTRPRIGVLLLLWIVPCLTIYHLYFWGIGAAGTAHTRFFLTILPAIVVCAVWVIDRARRWDGVGTLGAIGAGLFCAIPLSINATQSLGLFERDAAMASNLATLTDQVRNAAAEAADASHPKSSPRILLFAPQHTLWGELNQLDFALNAEVYAIESFQPGGRDWFINNGSDDPAAVSPLDLNRRRAVGKQEASLTPERRAADLAEIVRRARSQGRAVLLCGGDQTARTLPAAFAGLGEWRVVQRWRDPYVMSEEGRRRLSDLNSETHWAAENQAPRVRVIYALNVQ